MGVAHAGQILLRASGYSRCELHRHLADAREKGARAVMRQFHEELQCTGAYTVPVQACLALWPIEQICQSRQVHHIKNATNCSNF